MLLFRNSFKNYTRLLVKKSSLLETLRNISDDQNQIKSLAQVMRRNQIRNKFDIKDFLLLGYAPEVVRAALELSTELPEHDLSNIEICEFYVSIFIWHTKQFVVLSKTNFFNCFIFHYTYLPEVCRIQRLMNTTFL